MQIIQPDASGTVDVKSKVLQALGIHYEHEQDRDLAMKTPDPYGEWVVFGGKQGKAGSLAPSDEELVAAAREAWPHALAHARRELSERVAAPDRTAIAAEIWERVLRSVSRTRQRSPDHRPPVADLQAYLIGAFHLRFNRVLRREQRRLETFELLPSTFELEKFETARDVEWIRQLERDIAVKAVVACMDEPIRKIWKERQVGYSWKEIAKQLGISERHAKRKFHEGIERTRQRLIDLMQQRREKLKEQR